MPKDDDKCPELQLDFGVLQFQVHGRPVPKERPRLSKFGKAYTPARTKQYEAVVAKCATTAIKTCGWVGHPVDTFKVWIHVNRATDQGDIDNFAKSAMDGMNKVVFPDDRAVTEMHVRMVTDRKNPGIWIGVVRNERSAKADPANDRAKWIQSCWDVN